MFSKIETKTHIVTREPTLGGSIESGVHRIFHFNLGQPIKNQFLGAATMRFF